MQGGTARYVGRREAAAAARASRDAELRSSAAALVHQHGATLLGNFLLTMGESFVSCGATIVQASFPAVRKRKSPCICR